MASFSVVTNVAANNAQANLYATNTGLKAALNRVSSGFRINYSGDDAAGLAVANSYRSTIAVLTQGVRNANDGLSDLQIKDGALDNVSKLLDRLSTLATQAASGQTSAASRTTLNQEFQDVLAEINRENGRVGGNIGAVTTTTLGIGSDNLTTQSAAQTAVENIANAVNTLGQVQAQVGQLQNRLSYAINLAQSQIVNNKAAESRIRDANIAEESANLTRFNILNQSGIAALAQANGSTQAVLSLLR
jgi:flagellin